jgi:hypothetical protein
MLICSIISMVRGVMAEMLEQRQIYILNTVDSPQIGHPLEIDKSDILRSCAVFKGDRFEGCPI